MADLLSGAGNLRIVVSSRAPLRVSGEQECPVLPLAVPDEQAHVSPASVAACESVRLFAERATAVAPGFAVDGQNAAAVAQIVRRLDGLPLAIELAAARVKLLPPEAICGRLEHSLGLLTGGSRDLPRRQQTLRATIEWSYDLLGEEARGLLAACSVFRGGVPLDVIESVCAQAGASMTVLDGLQELVDQSLLRQLRAPGPPRYLVLETIREFAAERLAGTPQAGRLRGAHAAAFLALAEQAGRPLTGLGQREWLERLDAEHNNIRAAIDWLGRTDPPAALRLAAAMSWFWSLHGHYTEGRQRLRQLLGLVSAGDTVRVRALNGAAWLAIDQGDYPRRRPPAQPEHRAEPQAERQGRRGHGRRLPLPLHAVQRPDRRGGPVPRACPHVADRGGRPARDRVRPVLPGAERAVHGPAGGRLRAARAMRGPVPGTRLRITVRAPCSCSA